MAFLHDDILDDGLQVLTDDANALHICSQEPATYAEATTTYTLGNKAVPTVSAPGDRTPSGRKVTVSAITDGEVTATDTATHWALVDTVGERLLATNTLGAGQAVTDGNVFTLAAFDIGIPDPA
jgi:hypothetical protein